MRLLFAGAKLVNSMEQALMRTTILGTFRFCEVAPISAPSVHCPSGCNAVFHLLFWKGMEADSEASSLLTPFQKLLPYSQGVHVETVTTTQVSMFALHIWGKGK